MSLVQAAVLCDEGTSSSTPFVIIKEQRKKKEDKKGRLASDEILVDFEIFKILYRSHH